MGTGYGCTTAKYESSNSVKRDLAFAVDASLYPLIEGSNRLGVVFLPRALSMGLKDDPPSAVERAVGFIEATGHAHGLEHPIHDDGGDHRRRPAFGYSATPAKANPPRSSIALMSKPCVPSTRTIPCCTLFPLRRDCSSRSHSATSLAPGTRYRNPACGIVRPGSGRTASRSRRNLIDAHDS